MNKRLGKFLVLFFAACFLALQFHPVGATQLEINPKRILHIEEVSESVIDKGIDNRFVYVQAFRSKHTYLSKQNHKLKKQCQFSGDIERQIVHPFCHFMHECIAAICKEHQDKLAIIYEYLQQRELLFEFNPILITYIFQVHNDVPVLNTFLN